MPSSVVQKILVVGDLILDSFVYGDARRISPEAPVPVLLPLRECDLPGGAANVAANVDALGGHSVLLGIAGEDAAGDRLLKCIGNLPWREPPEILRSDRWQTPHKTRYCAGGQHLLRVDREREQGNEDCSAESRLRAACQAIELGVGQAVISNYGKGTLTELTCRSLMEMFRARNVPVLVDSKSADFGVFAGAALITPNLGELAVAAGRTVLTRADAVSAARHLMKRHRIAAAVVTMAADGMLVIQDDGHMYVPSSGRQIFDVTGAGDTVLAGLAVALCEGATLVEAARFASAAACVAVGRRGTTVVQRSDLSHSHEEKSAAVLLPAGNARDLKDLSDRVETWRSQGLRIGFTNGCFDILHDGHLRLIEEAAACCDRLIVAVNTDESVRILKGRGRPVQSESVRLRVISRLSGVAAAIAFGEETPRTLIEAIRPDVLVKGADYELDAIVGARETLARGGEVVRVPLLDGCSTTSTVELLRRGDESN